MWIAQEPRIQKKWTSKYCTFVANYFEEEKGKSKLSERCLTCNNIMVMIASSWIWHKGRGQGGVVNNRERCEDGSKWVMEEEKWTIAIKFERDIFSSESWFEASWRLSASERRFQRWVKIRAEIAGKSNFVSNSCRFMELVEKYTSKIETTLNVCLFLGLFFQHMPPKILYTYKYSRQFLSILALYSCFWACWYFTLLSEIFGTLPLFRNMLTSLPLLKTYFFLTFSVYVWKTPLDNFENISPCTGVCVAFLIWSRTFPELNSEGKNQHWKGFLKEN